MSVLDTMRGATTLTRRVTLCLDGSLQSEYDRLTSTLADASFADKDSLAGDNTRAVIDAMESVRDKMTEAEVSFTFTALPWLRRLALQGEHPPRDGNLADRNQGHNVETYTVALIREACASVVGVDGVVTTDIPTDVWDAMLTNLNFQQVDVLFSAAQAANDNATTVPPSARSLLGNRASGPSLSVPEPGASRRGASKGGSRPPRRKSTTTKPAASSSSPPPPTTPSGTPPPATKP